MSDDHAQIFKKRLTCPNCSDRSESSLAADFHCPLCGRRKSLFLQAFGVHEPTQKDEDDFTIHTLKLQLAESKEIAEAHEANYKYMANRAAEQQKEITRQAAEIERQASLIDPDVAVMNETNKLQSGLIEKLKEEAQKERIKRKVEEGMSKGQKHEIERQAALLKQCKSALRWPDEHALKRAAFNAIEAMENEREFK